MVAEAASVEEFCESRGQAVVGRPPASKPASVAITTPSGGIRPASLSRHKRVHSAKNVVAHATLTRSIARKSTCRVGSGERGARY